MKSRKKPGPPLTKESHLHMRIAENKLETYRAAAEREGRSLSNWVEWYLDRAVEARRQK